MAAISSGKRFTRRSAGAPAGRRNPDKRLDALLDAAASRIVDKGITRCQRRRDYNARRRRERTFSHYFENKAGMLQ